jgi:hypothetical protein
VTDATQSTIHPATIHPDATRATARLPGLDIEIVHQMSPDGSAEHISINLLGVPSFKAFGRFLEAANPLAFWMRAAQMAWAPWIGLGAAHAALLPQMARVLPTPQTEQPDDETPRTETPRAEMPRADTPRAETLRAEAPRAEPQRAATPSADTLRSDAPRADEPSPVRKPGNTPRRNRGRTRS